MFVSISKVGVMNILQSTRHLYLQSFYFRFYLSPERKNILAWTTDKTVPMNSMKDYKRLHLTKQNQLRIGVAGALSKMGKAGQVFKKLEVQSYEDKSLINPATYFYVELK